MLGFIAPACKFSRIVSIPVLHLRHHVCVREHRIIADSHLRIPIDSQLVRTAGQQPLIVACLPDADEEKAAQLQEKGVEVLRIPGVTTADITEEQKEVLENAMPARFCYSSDAGDSDYIYLRSELASLSGKAFHKKKNHFSKFVRTYPEYRFEQIGAANWQDAVLVEDMWYYEHLQEEDESQKKESAAVKEALEHFEQLELSGGLLYVNDTPAAMTVASVE